MKLLVLFLLWGLIVWMEGCATSELQRNGHDPLPSLTSLEIIPDQITVYVGKQITFQARGYDRDRKEIPVNPTWQAEGGNIGPNGIFTAGNSPGVYPITATVGEIHGTGQVTINPIPPDTPILTSIEVIPKQKSVCVEKQIDFRAIGYDQYGKEMAINPTWQAQGGTISPKGTFTAGNPGIYPITASVGPIQGMASISIEICDVPPIQKPDTFLLEYLDNPPDFASYFGPLLQELVKVYEEQTQGENLKTAWDPPREIPAEWNDWKRCVVRFNDAEQKRLKNGFMFRLPDQKESDFYIITCQHGSKEEGTVESEQKAKSLTIYLDERWQEQNFTTKDKIQVIEVIEDASADISILLCRNPKMAKGLAPTIKFWFEDYENLKQQIPLGKYERVIVLHWYVPGKEVSQYPGKEWKAGLLASVGNIHGIYGLDILHRASTSSGSSGAPVFRKLQGKEGLYLNGIHKAGYWDINQATSLHGVLLALLEQSGKSSDIRTQLQNIRETNTPSEKNPALRDALVKFYEDVRTMTESQSTISLDEDSSISPRLVHLLSGFVGKQKVEEAARTQKKPGSTHMKIQTDVVWRDTMWPGDSYSFTVVVETLSDKSLIREVQLHKKGEKKFYRFTIPQGPSENPDQVIYQKPFTQISVEDAPEDSKKKNRTRLITQFLNFQEKIEELPPDGKQKTNLNPQILWNNYVYIRDRHTFQHLGNGTILRVDDPKDNSGYFYLFTTHSIFQNKKLEDIMLVFPNPQGELRDEYSLAEGTGSASSPKFTLWVEEWHYDSSLDLSLLVWTSRSMSFVKPVPIYTGELAKNNPIAIVQWIDLNDRLMYTRGKIITSSNRYVENSGEVTPRSAGSPCFILSGTSETPVLAGIHREFLMEQGISKSIPFSIIWETLVKWK